MEGSRGARGEFRPAFLGGNGYAVNSASFAHLVFFRASSTVQVVLRHDSYSLMMLTGAFGQLPPHIRNISSV